MRLFVAVLLLACSSGAQTKPDFSGIFLRTETKIGKEHLELVIPRILASGKPATRLL
jgi:hypothetical protein